MFAVLKTGGKQYRVSAGDRLKVEKVAGEAGDTVEFSEVLMVGDTVGAPLVEGAMVAAEIVEHGRARKVIAFKKRRRQNSRRTIGHRQHFSILEITEILTDGKKPSKKAAAKKADKSADAKADKTEGKADSKKSASKDKTADKAADKKPAKAKAAAKDDAAPVALFTAPEGEPDDLKKISGVGPVLEKKLHAFGVTKFAQVAAFSQDDIEKLDEALSFKGRIDRDDWVGQAAKLAEESGK